MARVGFRGLGIYQELKLAELDQRADRLADRIDAMVVKGATAVDAHAKVLEQREHEIAEFEKAATELSNGGPPLDELPKPSATSQVTPFRSGTGG
jgi:hypothetical protein